MLNKRRKLILEIEKMDQKLQYQQAQVIKQKNEILASFQHYYLILIGVLSGAFLLGWEIGKELNMTQISKQLLKNGLQFLISHYPLIQN